MLDIRSLSFNTIKMKSISNTWHLVSIYWFKFFFLFISISNKIKKGIEISNVYEPVWTFKLMHSQGTIFKHNIRKHVPHTEEVVLKEENW